MPFLRIYRHFTTKPFAGDDLQIVCIVLGTYRVIQVSCLVPLIIKTLLMKFSGHDLLVNGYPIWCLQSELFWSDPTMIQTLAEYEEKEITRSFFLSEFVLLSSAFLAIDISWMVMVWAAASVGNPSRPNGRDEYLRKLILFKTCFINLIPIGIIIFGCLKVHDLRTSNYGCDDQPLVAPPPDSGVFYDFFCVLIISLAFELLVWPAIIANKILRWIRNRDVIQRGRYTTNAQVERLDLCLGGLMKYFCTPCCCNNQGGKEFKNQGELKDFANAMMEFANSNTSLGLVFSDMFVGLMLLERVQAERKYMAITQVQHWSNVRSSRLLHFYIEEDDQCESPRNAILPFDFSATTVKQQHLAPTANIAPKEKLFTEVQKNVLTNGNPEDVEVLRQAGHFCTYASCIYHHIHKLVVEDFLPSNSTSFIRDLSITKSIERFVLTKIGIPHAHIFYANVYNGIAATPYCILVDEDEKCVVITIRGSLSLDDWVTNLQYVPRSLGDVGELCGFDGEGHFCHEGMLTRCKWIYNDIKRCRVLNQLYSDSSAYKDYSLVVVGHSLGGGCAQILSLMLRPSFPSLRCFAYEPPGCVFDDLLCKKSEEWIVSIVRHDDVVPRFTPHNIEQLRDEFLNVLLRIKVPKYQAFHDIRTHCPKSHLVARNAEILCPEHMIDKDTEFYQRVEAMRNKRDTENKYCALQLYIPGRIIHLVDTKGDETKYVPYWESRYEFNQVILSKRMIADHDYGSLPDLLKSIKLDEYHEVDTTWFSRNEEKEDDVHENEEMHFIIPCSHPQGRIPVILLILICFACLLLSFSTSGCKFVSRTSVIYSIDGTSPFPILSPNTGLWSYNLVQCIAGQECTGKSSLNDSNYVDTDYCYPYAMMFTPNPYMIIARACTSANIILVLLGFVFVSTATCIPLKKRTWCWLCVWFLLVTTCQGLQFLMLKGDVCSEWHLPGSESLGTVVSHCKIARDGYIGMAAVIVWFAIAVGCSHMAKIAHQTNPRSSDVGRMGSNCKATWRRFTS